jgi:indole-3-glycerol phosphate synthase
MTKETYLDSILVFHRERVQKDSRSLTKLLNELPREIDSIDSFMDRIKNQNGLSIIAEIKRKSPSKGLLKHDLDPVGLAQIYESGGAACISVLTDTEHFGGSEQDLINVRQAVKTPVLRKDFTVDLRDIYDAKIMGASCVLLIVAALGIKELTEYIDFCDHLGLDSLVEAHDEAEVEIALKAGAKMIGINQRDLRTFEVDQTRALRVAAEIPDGIVKIAESGIKTVSDAEPLKLAGFDGVLIGESLVKSENPKNLITELRNL